VSKFIYQKNKMMIIKYISIWSLVEQELYYKIKGKKTFIMS